MNFASMMKHYGFMRLYDYVDADPKARLPKLLDWVDQLSGGKMAAERAAARAALSDPENNWYQLLYSLWTDVDSGVRRRTFANLAEYAGFLWGAVQQGGRQRPVLCSLHTGAALEEMETAIRRWSERGIRLYALDRGGPVKELGHVVALTKRHRESTFFIWTSGDRLDGELAQDFLAVQNIIPIVYTQDMAACTRGMEILRRSRLLFGYAAVLTPENLEELCSPELLSHMAAMGGKFGLYDCSALSEPARDFASDRLRGLRTIKPVLTIELDALLRANPWAVVRGEVPPPPPLPR